MRKIFYIITILVCMSCFTNVTLPVAHATEAENEQVANLDSEVKEQLENIDLDQMESLYNETVESVNLSGDSFKETIYKIISGEVVFSLDSVINMVFGTITSQIKSVLEIIVVIVAIVAISSMADLLRKNSQEKSVSVIVGYITILIILSIIAKIIADNLSSTIVAIKKIKTSMEIVSPLLMALLIAIGGTASVKVYQPTLLMFTNVVLEIIIHITIVIIPIYFVLSLLSELTPSIRFDKLKNFLSSSYKWIVGMIFTLFVGFLSLNGVSASRADGISIKTTKYAIKNYIPIVGGYVADSYELFRAGSVLIKNAVGVVSVIILFSIVISRVITLIIYNLGLKFAGGIIEPLGVSSVSRFMASVSNVFNFLIASIASVFMMCFISIMLIISTANML